MTHVFLVLHFMTVAASLVRVGMALRSRGRAAFGEVTISSADLVLLGHDCGWL